MNPANVSSIILKWKCELGWFLLGRSHTLCTYSYSDVVHSPSLFTSENTWSRSTSSSSPILSTSVMSFSGYMATWSPAVYLYNNTHIPSLAHARTHAHTHTHTNTYMHIHMHTHTHKHTCTHACTHTHMYTRPHTHTRTHTHMHAHTQHTHTRMHTYTQSYNGLC